MNHSPFNKRASFGINQEKEKWENLWTDSGSLSTLSTDEYTGGNIVQRCWK
jgi:hypothetical protein